MKRRNGFNVLPNMFMVYSIFNLGKCLSEILRLVLWFVIKNITNKNGKKTR